ncbi:replicative helicase [Ralstonia phage RP13]|nr:replicative helicase [Ralstonia phage RP13]
MAKYDTELVHIAALCNPSVFKYGASVIADIPWGTDVGKKLFPSAQAIDHYSDATLASMLTSVLVADEIDGFIQLVNESRKITDQKQIREMVDSLFAYYKTRKVHQIVTDNSSDVDAIVREIKLVPESLTAGIDIHTIGKLDPEQIIAEEMGDLGNPLPTNFDLIKDSTPFKGYLPGQVVQWVGAPGRGKSATMLFEVILMAISGFKVLWLAMGDLTKYDFMSRLTAVISGQPYYKVAMNLSKYFTDDIREVANNIDLITIPAGRITSSELLALVQNSPVDYAVVVADYDSNFKMTNTNSSYEAGGEVYNDLTEIARPGGGRKNRLVFIASQPKIQYWEELEIPLEGAGESSRKQHIIDMMITMGTAGADRPAGMMCLPKVRRGKAGGKTPYMMDDSGRVLQIGHEQLALMRQYKG